jgi:hypothetical protein
METTTDNFTGTSMSRQNVIILATLVGAGVAAALAAYFTTETGKQMLSNAAEQLKDLSGKAKEIAKNTAGEVLNETRNSIGSVVKDKIVEQVNKV